MADERFRLSRWQICPADHRPANNLLGTADPAHHRHRRWHIFEYPLWKEAPEGPGINNVITVSTGAPGKGLNNFGPMGQLVNPRGRGGDSWRNDDVRLVGNRVSDKIAQDREYERLKNEKVVPEDVFDDWMKPRESEGAWRKRLRYSRTKKWQKERWKHIKFDSTVGHHHDVVNFYRQLQRINYYYFPPDWMPYDRKPDPCWEPWDCYYMRTQLDEVEVLKDPYDKARAWAQAKMIWLEERLQEPQNQGIASLLKRRMYPVHFENNLQLTL